MMFVNVRRNCYASLATVPPKSIQNSLRCLFSISSCNRWLLASLQNAATIRSRVYPSRIGSDRDRAVGEVRYPAVRFSALDRPKRVGY